MKDTDLMPFGRYEGTPMQGVPASYLDWLHGKMTSPSQVLHSDAHRVLAYIDANRNVIDKELKEQGRIE